jgi:predicted acyltransferase
MAPTNRFLALDVFRGMTICFMIIVNTPGSGATSYAPLLHARWHGFTPTDLVFPSFLFAVGNSLSFVILKWNALKTSQVLWKIFKRSFLIFLLGYLMYWFPFVRHNAAGDLVLSPIGNTRILGVLQRIAICYAIASLLIYYLKPRAIIVFSATVLLLYWGAMMYFGDPGNELTLTGNAGSKLDLFLLDPKHLYHGEGLVFEPEGFLSTLPSVVNVIGGYFAGRYLQGKGKTYESLTGLLLAGCALVLLGYCWDFAFPINKKLWTSSFVLYTIGLDCIILAGIIYLIDFLKQTRWTYFFEVFGRNPLFIYLLSEIGATLLWILFIGNTPLHAWLYGHIFSRAGAYFGSFLFAVFFMLSCWVIGWLMDKKKIYIRV